MCTYVSTTWFCGTHKLVFNLFILLLDIVIYMLQPNTMVSERVVGCASICACGCFAVHVCFCILFFIGLLFQY